MTLDLKSFSEQFKFFLKHTGKYFLFTTLFYSLWLVKAYFLSHDFILHAFKGRMIGIATLEAYDVGARVSTFYKSIGVLIGSFFLFNLLAFFLSKKKEAFARNPETKIINYTSLAGIAFLFAEALGYTITQSIEWIYFLHKVMLLGCVLQVFAFKKPLLTTANYTIILLLSTSLYFFIADCFTLSGQLTNPDFFITTFIICSILIVSAQLSLKHLNIADAQQTMTSWAGNLVPLAFLPVASVLKDETFLVLKAKGYSVGLVSIYVVLVLLLSLLVLLRNRKKKKASQEHIIAMSYFPVFIFSLLTFLNYSYFINYSDEVFEAGNKYLPIMEFKLFGVIPTVEKFNSHLLADYFYSGIYTLVNGLQGSEMELYDFLNASFSYLVYYFLVYYLTRNAYVAAFCILLFPFCTAMMPESFAFGVFAIFALNKLFTNAASLKSYVFFLLVIAGLILWRIDLGYTCLVVMVVLLFYYHFASTTFKINWILLSKALLIVLGSAAALLAILSFYRDANLFKKSLNALNYFTSAQTYGYSTVYPPALADYGKMHFYVFPVAVGILILALMLKFRALTISRNQRLAYLSLLFICCFYLVNFNRGLIRHSLMEWVDHFTSSYLYVIIPGTIYVFFYKRPQVFKFTVFFFFSVFILTSYKLPDPKGSKSYAEKTIEKIQSFQKTDLSEIHNRVKNKPSYENDIDSPFIDFIAKNTSSAETFIDFSNNSMLYFYTKKISPSYFYQNPLCSHNDFLQDVFIEDLKEYEVPYLLFSRNDDQGRDAVDEVPNTLRHYKMAEYFYQHYEPYALTGYLRIWKAKERENVNKQRVLFTYEKHKNDTTFSLNYHVKQKKAGANYFAKIETAYGGPLDVKVITGQESTSTHLEYISGTTAYCVIAAKGNNFSLQLQNKNGNIQKLELIACDYIPDFYSEKFLSLDFMKLPYIWGTYDEKLSKEPLLFEDPREKTAEKNNLVTVKIPSHLATASGNTLVFCCENKSGKLQKMVLSFGKSTDKNRTRVTFDVLPSDKKERYAIRISSIYKWYSDNPDLLEFNTESGQPIAVSGIQITKGL